MSKKNKLYGTGFSKGSFERMVEVNQGYNKTIDGLYKRRSKMKFEAYELLVLCRLAKNFRQQVEKILKKLPERERNVLKFRVFNEFTLEKVAKIIGVTRERIRQLEAKALRKLNWQLQFGNVSFYLNYKEGKPITQKIIKVIIPKDLSEIPIRFVSDWSVRTLNCFGRAKIKTLGDLKKYKLDGSVYDRESLLGFRQFGKKSLAEVRSKLAGFLVYTLFKEGK